MLRSTTTNKGTACPASEAWCSHACGRLRGPGRWPTGIGVYSDTDLSYLPFTQANIPGGSGSSRSDATVESTLNSFHHHQINPRTGQSRQILSDTDMSELEVEMEIEERVLARAQALMRAEVCSIHFSLLTIHEPRT